MAPSGGGGKSALPFTPVRMTFQDLKYSVALPSVRPAASYRVSVAPTCAQPPSTLLAAGLRVHRGRRRCERPARRPPAPAQGHQRQLPARRADRADGL